MTLADVAGRIRDAYFPALPPDAPGWQERTDQRDRLARILQLEQGPFGRLKARIAVLTPPLSGLVGLLLGAR